MLDHVSEQMSHVSNDRRSQLTLGEFLARHHYLSGSSLRKYSSDVLKSQIERVIGGISSQDDAAAAIDWQLAGVQSHPASGVNIGDAKQRLDAKLNERLTMASLNMLSNHDDAPAKLSVQDEGTGAIREQGASSAVQ